MELALKGMLRAVGLEPQHFHDVGGFLVQYRDRFPSEIQPHVDRCAQISKWLRKERELAFCGDIDFIPTQQYVIEDSQRAISDARWVCNWLAGQYRADLSAL